MQRVIWTFIVLALTVVAHSAPPTAAKASGSAKASKEKASQKRRAGLELFEKKIRPALIQHCYECHSEQSDDLGGGLLVDSREGLFAGGDSGAAIRRGKPADSLLMHALEYRDLEMPPDEPLSPDVVADFRRWISLGAPDPRRRKTDPVQQDAPTKPIDLWSLQPVTNPRPPEVNNAGWPLSDIDRFILAALEEKGISPNADAAPFTLLRRLYFDLVGLPPSPQELADFAKDPSDEHYAAIVDRLLASRGFGERWGRHWLDVARYGESAGSSRDVLMLYAWRYRDYVIDAFCDDVPLDRFITEQIAGDLLDAENDDQRRKQIIATGLLALGSKSLNGGNLTYDIVDDQIDVVSKAVLGLTVACARCHDHKFDPIPTADYYSLAGIFLSTETLYGGSTKRPKNAKEKEQLYLRLSSELSPEEIEQQKIAQKNVETFQKQVKSSNSRIKNLLKDVPSGYRNDPEKPIAENLSDAQRSAIRQYQGAVRNLKKREALLAEAKAALPDEPQYAFGVREAKKIIDGNVLIRGEKGKTGDPVKRGFLSTIDPVIDPEQAIRKSINAKQSGRLELAAWLTHPRHPLTPRVAVNRVWQHLMGTGIVETVDNFGVSGTKPSHPQLLDFLAHRFVHQQNWSIKSVVREVVMSRTYRLSTSYDENSYAADSENRLRWRMDRRRLEAEPLRDAMLAVSGRLRFQPLEGSLVMQIGEGEVGRNIDTSVLDEPFDHRSVYLPIIRGIIPEQLRVFDFPEPSNVQGLRDSNTTPTQSLYLMNSPFVMRASESFADHLLAQTQLKTDADRVTHAHLRCFARAPDQKQIREAIEFIDDLATRSKANHAAPDARRRAWAAYCQSLLASAPFRFID
tara:strand:- start:36691 stop:39258 length:2568 start_codon:yes stop_codon:yes gene_type:complete